MQHMSSIINTPAFKEAFIFRAFISSGAVTKSTIRIAQDGFARSGKKMQPYRGTARLSDEETGKPDRQGIRINSWQVLSLRRGIHNKRHPEKIRMPCNIFPYSASLIAHRKRITIIKSQTLPA